MNDSNTYDSSDLIYLFLDGEVDDVQRATLFSALANDAELQAEFADALSIRGAAEAERTGVRPPDHVTEALFTRAGFAPAAPEAAPAPLVVVPAAGSAGAATGVASTGRSFVARIAPYVLSALIGAGTALFFTGRDVPTVAETTTVDAPIAQVEGESAAVRSTASADEIAGDATAGDRSMNAGRDVVAQHAGRSGAGSPRMGRTTSGREATALDINRGDHTRAVIARDGNVDATADSAASALPAAPEGTTSPADAHVDIISLSPSALIGADRVLLDTSSAQAYAKSDAGALAGGSLHRTLIPPPLTFQARGIATLEYFPHRNLGENVRGDLENIALSVRYRLSRNHSVGVELGRERHPLYIGADGDDINMLGNVQGTNPGGNDPPLVINGTSDGGGLGSVGSIPGTDPSTAKEMKSADTRYVVHPWMEWAGALYRYQMDPIEGLARLRPFAQGLVGVTRSGPVGKGTIGVTYAPDARVSLGLGLEGTTLLYQRDDRWFSTRKLGVTYSIEIDL